MLFLHNLTAEAVSVDVGQLSDEATDLDEVFGDQRYPLDTLDKLTLGGYGYRWIRLRNG
jgi:maltose alpha-D-glucosyltransferase/alpha-amylase